MLWTIVPPEVLLAGYDDDDDDSRQMMTIRRGALTMEVEPLGGPVARIMRVLSSDPADYLDERWQPGSFVDLWSNDYS